MCRRTGLENNNNFATVFYVILAKFKPADVHMHRVIGSLLIADRTLQSQFLPVKHFTRHAHYLFHASTHRRRSVHRCNPPLPPLFSHARTLARTHARTHAERCRPEHRDYHRDTDEHSKGFLYDMVWTLYDMRNCAVLQEEAKVVILRFGSDAEPSCMQMDEVNGNFCTCQVYLRKISATGIHRPQCAC